MSAPEPNAQFGTNELPLALDTLAELCREHRSRLVNYAARWTRTRHDAEDAVQTAFVIAVERMAEVRPENATAWLTAITRRCAQRWGRECRRTVAAGDAIEYAAQSSTEERATAGGRCMADDQTAAHVRDVLSQLPPRQRQTLHLWAVEGLAWAEVAERMGVTVTTARSTGYTTLRRLRASSLEVVA